MVTNPPLSSKLGEGEAQPEIVVAVAWRIVVAIG